MPRKMRLTKLRRTVELPATVRLFLDEGVLPTAYGDRWLAYSLTFPGAKAARAAWLAGDQAGALECLGQCPGNVFGGRG